jgi:hypothetical protein
MKLIQGNEAGFFAMSNDTARHISQCINNNEKWFVHWGSNTCYYDKNKGENVWEYYFKQPYMFEHPDSTVRDYTDLVLLKNNSFRATMNYIYSNYFVLNEQTHKLVEPHFSYFEQNKVLGVHIRRTDKFLINYRGTTPDHAPVDLELFKKEIDAVANDYDSIYLATDCTEACNFMKNTYGKKLIFNRNGNRGIGTQSIHHDSKFNNISGYLKGLDVLTDAIYLSKCKHLIRSSSNVSIAALYLNLNLTELNLNEKYLGNTESKTYL